MKDKIHSLFEQQTFDVTWNYDQLNIWGAAKIYWPFFMFMVCQKKEIDKL